MRSSLLALAVVAAFAVTTGAGFAQEPEVETATDQDREREQAAEAAPAPALDLPPPPAPPTLPSDGSQPQINAARAELRAVGGSRVSGTLLLSPDNFGLRISGRITGLRNDAEHGFHIHETGDCGNDASRAGDHFNPDNHPHGEPSSNLAHAGDLPNLQTDNRGNAEINFHAEHVTLGDGGERDVLGRALVVHAQADDFTSQPAGASGDRIACAVIEAVPAPALAEPTNGNGNG